MDADVAVALTATTPSTSVTFSMDSVLSTAVGCIVKDSGKLQLESARSHVEGIRHHGGCGDVGHEQQHLLALAVGDGHDVTPCNVI